MSHPTLLAGQTFALPPERLDTARILAFGAAGADESPSHFSDAEARAVGFPKALAHGMLGMALLGRLVTEALPDARLLRLDSRFVAMTFHDDSLSCLARIAGIDAAGIVTLALSATNQHGETVLTGNAVVTLG